MYLQKGEIIGKPVEIEADSNSDIEIEEQDFNIKEEHDQWKSHVRSSKCRNFKSMSYWNVVSHNNIL